MGREQALRVARILNLCFIGSVAAYTGLLWGLKRIGVTITLPEEILWPVKLAFFTVAGLKFLAGLVWPFGKEVAMAPQRRLALYLMRCAVMESVALYGAVLGVLGAGWGEVAPLLAAGGAGLALIYPREWSWPEGLGAG